ncbi:hypothetical protein SNE40_016850 [Patella caerulea]|uniref:Uncharacterized protein n=1 Tax=Patella caerulea TaxID=87958 RepID=A0AAN8JE12_PATCE
MLKESESTKKVIAMLKVDDIPECLRSCLLDNYPQVMLAKLELDNFSYSSGNSNLLFKFRSVLSTNTVKHDNLDNADDSLMKLDITMVKGRSNINSPALYVNHLLLMHQW